MNKNRFLNASTVVVFRLIMLYLAYFLTVAFYPVFYVAGLQCTIFISKNSSDVQYYTVAVFGIFPLLLSLFYIKDKTIRVFSIFLLAVYLNLQSINFLLESYIAEEVRMGIEQYLILILLAINFINILYPTKALQSLLKLLPIVSVLWLYDGMIFSPLTMVVGHFLYGFYSSEHVLSFVSMSFDVFTLYHWAIFAIFIPLILFLISAYSEKLYQFLRLYIVNNLRLT